MNPAIAAVILCGFFFAFGVLIGWGLSRRNAGKSADDVTTGDTRQGIHDEIVRQSGTEYYSPPLHGGAKRR